MMTKAAAKSGADAKAGAGSTHVSGTGSGAKVAYDEKAIQTLDALSHIRLRTGMYIGRLGDGSTPVDGIYVMMKEVVDNSIDEFIMGAGKKIEIARDGATIEVRDFGRGIPLGKVVDCVSQINTGGKYNDDVFQFSVGLNGVGTKAVNALSSAFGCRARGQDAPRPSRGKWSTAGSARTRRARGWCFRPIGSWAFPANSSAPRYYAFLNAGSRSYQGQASARAARGSAGARDGQRGAALPARARTRRAPRVRVHAHALLRRDLFSFVNGQHPVAQARCEAC
jgi:hypothetical protein